MKTMRRILAVALAVLAAVACRPSGGKDLKTETMEYEDSTAHADLSVKVELPVPGQGAAAENIRKKLVEVMDGQLSHIGTYEEERQFPAFKGDAGKTESLLTYYRDKARRAEAGNPRRHARLGVRFRPPEGAGDG